MTKYLSCFGNNVPHFLRGTGVDHFNKKEVKCIVLHHPHTTVTTGTWRNGCSTVNRILPSVRQYAGAGRFIEPDRKKSGYNPLSEVLEATKKGDTINFIVGGKGIGNAA